MINEGNAELIAKHPDRFGAFATLPGDGPGQALTELSYALDELGLDGVVLTSNVGGHYFGDPALEPVLMELARRQVPVFVHPVDSPVHRRPGLRPAEFDRGVPLRHRAQYHHALYTGVFQRIPGLRLILAHCGGAHAHARLADRRAHRHGPRTARRGYRPRPCRRSTARALLRDRAGRQSQLAAAHTEVTGPDHILFGTDWPAAPEPTVVHNIANLTGFDGFTQDELRGVERDNALKLFPRFA